MCTVIIFHYVSSIDKAAPWCHNTSISSTFTNFRIRIEDTADGGQRNLHVPDSAINGDLFVLKIIIFHTLKLCSETE